MGHAASKVAGLSRGQRRRAARRRGGAAKPASRWGRSWPSIAPARSSCFQPTRRMSAVNRASLGGRQSRFRPRRTNRAGRRERRNRSGAAAGRRFRRSCAWPAVAAAWALDVPPQSNCRRAGAAARRSFDRLCGPFATVFSIVGGFPARLCAATANFDNLAHFNHTSHIESHLPSPPDGPANAMGGRAATCFLELRLSSVRSPRGSHALVIFPLAVIAVGRGGRLGIALAPAAVRPTKWSKTRSWPTTTRPAADAPACRPKVPATDGGQARAGHREKPLRRCPIRRSSWSIRAPIGLKVIIRIEAPDGAVKNVIATGPIPMDWPEQQRAADQPEDQPAGQVQRDRFSRARRR